MEKKLSQSDILKLRGYYIDVLREFGSQSSRAIGWTTKETQVKRFEVLSRIGDLNNKSVLDVGCGLGDFYPFLASHFENIRYKGIDIMPETIVEAKNKYPGIDFEVCDFLEYEGGEFDYCLSSGSLSLSIPDFKEKYFGMIKKMFEISRIGVGFNMLRVGYDADTSHFALYDPLEVMKFCSTFASKSELVEGYLDYDFTVFLYK